MSAPRTFALTAMTMIAFAGNSLLCRQALHFTEIDAASFTVLRLFSGALVLMLLVRIRGGSAQREGDPIGAGALFAYAAGFSLAYESLGASTGALLLFGAVQATMIGHGVARGERLRVAQVVGLSVALGGLVALLAPGLTAPPWRGAALMIAAGGAWGVYSLRGQGRGDPLAATAGNFVLSLPLAILFVLVRANALAIDAAGTGWAVASGAIASGLGYAIWYTVLPALRATTAATVQLSVPVIAAVGGIALLDEPLTLRLVVASVAILGGITTFVLQRRGARS